MSFGKVWSRFETKKKDGTVINLRIQDLPSGHDEEVTELMLRYYATEEPCHKATNIAGCPETKKIYEDFLTEYLPNPDFSCVICCPDDSEEITSIIGVSAMLLTREYTWGFDKEDHKSNPKEWVAYNDICKDLLLQFNPMKQYNLSTIYDDMSLAVIPEFRGLGVARELLKSRRLICQAHGVPMTGGWMSSLGTQIAAARDGWEVVFEIRYEDLGKRCGIAFNDAPETMKYMIARAGGGEKCRAVDN